MAPAPVAWCSAYVDKLVIAILLVPVWLWLWLRLWLWLWLWQWLWLWLCLALIDKHRQDLAHILISYVRTIFMLADF
jgi:hypothetical protein